MFASVLGASNGTKLAAIQFYLLRAESRSFPEIMESLFE